MGALNLDYLRTFALVADLGSFSAAAERLGLTQPAISLQVRALEKQLGVRLVERVGRTARPSAAGAELLAHAGRIEAATSQAIEAVARHAKGVLGRVRPTRKALDAVRGCGLKGLVLDAGGGIGRTPAEDAIVLRAFVEAGVSIAPNLIVHGLADPVMVEVAKAAGVTHASLEPELRATAIQVDAA